MAPVSPMSACSSVKMTLGLLINTGMGTQALSTLTSLSLVLLWQAWGLRQAVEMEEVSARLMSGEPCWRLMENWRVGPGRVWLKRPRSTGRPLVGGCTREAELETASLSSPRASFHSVPYERYRDSSLRLAYNIILWVLYRISHTCTHVYNNSIYL